MDEASFRAKMANEGRTVREVVREPGTVIDTHSHDFAASILVLEGEITVTYDGRAVTCGPGDTFSLAANIPHAERIGADGVRLLSGRF